MPCEDVTEVLRIALDAEDFLSHYELIKRSCGRAVGEKSLLLERWQGESARVLADLDGDQFADALGEIDDTELVLSMKHFFAVQGALRVLLGHDAGGPFDPIRVATVSGTDDGGCAIEAEIVIDILTEKIQSCGRCKGCGVKKQPV